MLFWQACEVGSPTRPQHVCNCQIHVYATQWAPFTDVKKGGISGFDNKNEGDCEFSQNILSCYLTWNTIWTILWARRDCSTNGVACSHKSARIISKLVVLKWGLIMQNSLCYVSGCIEVHLNRKTFDHISARIISKLVVLKWGRIMQNSLCYVSECIEVHLNRKIFEIRGTLATFSMTGIKTMMQKMRIRKSSKNWIVESIFSQACV